MSTKRSSGLTCASCGSTFRRPSNRGRLPLFCSPSCRSSAYRARTTVRPGVPPEHDEAAARVAEDTRASVTALLAAARSLAPGAPMELVNRAVTIRQDAEDMLAVAVRKARSHGATWEQIGLATSLAADSARGHWSGDQVARVLQRRSNRAASPGAPGRPGAPAVRGVADVPRSAGGPPRTEAPEPAEAVKPAEAPKSAGGPGSAPESVPASGPPSASGPGPASGPVREAGGAPGPEGACAPGGVPRSEGDAGPGADGTAGRRGAPPRAPGGCGEQERRGAEQLALAMSHLRTTRRSSARAVARCIGVSASLLSLVLAGKRLPSWEVTEGFARACDADPGDLVRLWEQAHGIAPAPTASPVELRTLLRCALRGLYLAAREPDLPAVGRATGQAFGREQLACLVDSSAPPPTDWPVLERVVSALGGRPEDIRPLWLQAADALQGVVRLPAPVDDPLGRPGLPAAAFG